jgi:hypothetical protein
MGAPLQLYQGGWKPGTLLKPGDEVKVVVRPTRDGTQKAGLFVSATRADGTVLGKTANEPEIDRTEFARLRRLLATAVVGAQKSEPRSRSFVFGLFASLPNWTGLLDADDGVVENALGVSGRTENSAADFVRMKLAAPLPYYPPSSPRRRQAARKNSGATRARSSGFSVPVLIGVRPWVLQFLITPEETDVIVAGREIRHIYTDGRAHPSPDDVWPTPWGDSVGKWEGNVLTVDTIAVKSGTFPPLVSEHARYSERIRMVSADRMEDEITVVDPAALTKEWKVSDPVSCAWPG